MTAHPAYRDQPETCRWCGYDRPDHEETCPVRKIAEGLATTMAVPIGAVTDFNFAVSEETLLSAGTRYINALPVSKTRDDCSWQTGSVGTEIVTACGCGTHIGEPMTLINPSA